MWNYFPDVKKLQFDNALKKKLNKLLGLVLLYELI